jgi:hypothetical protein
MEKAKSPFQYQPTKELQYPRKVIRSTQMQPIAFRNLGLFFTENMYKWHGSLWTFNKFILAYKAVCNWTISKTKRYRYSTILVVFKISTLTA